MTGAKRDPGTSANFRYTTSTDMTKQWAAWVVHGPDPA